MRGDNQDNWIGTGLSDGGLLVAVADGIGGAPGGGQASRMAVEVLREVIHHGEQAEMLAEIVQQANLTIHQEASHRAELGGMGTTLTAAVLWRSRLVLAHVGDSRAYCITPQGAFRLTDDHSVAGEMERVGSISADEALRHPQRHVLTRAVGPFATVRVDSKAMAWSSSDRLLLCTDGLYNALSEEQLFRMCERFTGQAAVDALIAQALKQGGHDNVTVVMVDSGMELV